MASGRGLAWWNEGWQLFAKAPLAWIMVSIVFVVILFALAFIPIIGQLACSFIYPVLGAGVLLGTRSLDRGGELTVGHLFACFNDKAVPLVIVALLYFVGWLVIWAIGAGVLIGVAGLKSLSALTSGDPVTAAEALLSGIGLSALLVALLMLALSVPLIMAYWFAPALVVFRNDNPIAAMQSSFTACMRNMPPFTVYGLVGIVLAVIASIPLGLGWLILLPVYAATIYTSYKDIFGAPPTR